MPRKGKLARGVAIVGGGLTKLGLFKDRNGKAFFAEAFVEMVESVDKGLDPKEIEATYVGNYSNNFFVNQSHWGPIIADLLGQVPKPVTRTEGACASSALAFREGVLAIASGLYDIVLVGGFEQIQMDDGRKWQKASPWLRVPMKWQQDSLFLGSLGRWPPPILPSTALTGKLCLT